MGITGAAPELSSFAGLDITGAAPELSSGIAPCVAACATAGSSISLPIWSCVDIMRPRLGRCPGSRLDPRRHHCRWRRRACRTGCSWAAGDRARAEVAVLRYSTASLGLSAYLPLASGRRCPACTGQVSRTGCQELLAWQPLASVRRPACMGLAFQTGCQELSAYL